MKNIWQWLSKPKNQTTLKFLGGGVAVVVVAAWTVFIYFHKPEPPAPSPDSSTHISVSEMHGGNLSGRDQYITTIEGISEERFQSLSEELGVTRAALKSFFKILKEKQVPREDLDSTLHQIANRHKDIEAQLRHFASEDPEVATLKRQAGEALDVGEFDRAEELLNQAKEKDI